MTLLAVVTVRCFAEWKQSEVVILLDQIQAVMTNDDNIKYSTMADKLEWDKVKVGQHTPSECKDQWINITTKVYHCLFTVIKPDLCRWVFRAIR